MLDQIAQTILATPDFPKKGVLYWDSTPLYQHPRLLREVVAAMTQHVKIVGADSLVAIEAKGFLLGGALSYATALPLVTIRKAGLTPGEVEQSKFIKEYGDGVYQLRANALAGHRSYLLYDILASAGATRAALDLIAKCKGTAVGAGYIVELEYLSARSELSPLPIFSLLKISERRRDGYQAA